MRNPKNIGILTPSLAGVVILKSEKSIQPLLNSCIYIYINDGDNKVQIYICILDPISLTSLVKQGNLQVLVSTHSTVASLSDDDFIYIYKDRVTKYCDIYKDFMIDKWSPSLINVAAAIKGDVRLTNDTFSLERRRVNLNLKEHIYICSTYSRDYLVPIWEVENIQHVRYSYEDYPIYPSVPKVNRQLFVEPRYIGNVYIYMKTSSTEKLYIYIYNYLHCDYWNHHNIDIDLDITRFIDSCILSYRQKTNKIDKDKGIYIPIRIITDCRSDDELPVAEYKPKDIELVLFNSNNQIKLFTTQLI